MNVVDKNLVRILYVEDDVNLRQLVKHILEEMGGFTVELCEDGEDALSKAEQFKPQLALLDVRMPGIDGTTTFRRLKELPGLEDLNGIFITTFAEPGDLAVYEELGALACIPKPIDPGTLVEKVSKIWSERGV